MRLLSTRRMLMRLLSKRTMVSTRTVQMRPLSKRTIANEVAKHMHNDKLVAKHKKNGK